MPVIKLDSWFARISQALGREKASPSDSRDELRYAVRKINQFLYAEKPNADLIDKHANVIVDLLLSLSNGTDDFEFITQVFNIIREILDCDKRTSRPLVKALIKNDVCSFLLHTLRIVSEDRGLGQDISLQIHQILAAIGHHDKRLALKARLFKTIGATIALLRVYSYNAKVCPVILTLLKIYAKNAITAANICRAAGLQPLLRLALTLDRRHAKLQKLSITVVRHLTQTKKLAARAATTTIVRDILAVVFLMDKSQGQNRARTVKIKEGLLKVLLNLVKSKAGRVQFLEANGFYLLYELALNVLPNDYSYSFVDIACQVLLHCCPKQQLPLESIFSPVRVNLPQGYDFIVANEFLSADPQIIKDLDDMREKCKSVTPGNERSPTLEPRARPKSSIGSSMAKLLSATKSTATMTTSTTTTTVLTAATPTPVTTTTTTTATTPSRPKSAKGKKAEKKKVESKGSPKKKSSLNGTKYRPLPALDANGLDDAEDGGMRLADDEELDEEDSSKSDDNDEEDDDEEDEGSNKNNLLDSSVPLPNDDQAVRDSVDLARDYEQFFDEMVDPVYLLRSKMSQSTLEPPIESLLSRLFRHIVPSLLTPLSPQSKFNYWRMPSDLYFKVYSTLAKSTRSAYEFAKLAYPDAFNAISFPRLEPMQKFDERGNRSILLGDIRRVIYPSSIVNRTVYDFDAMLDQSTGKTLKNDDAQRCQTRSSLNHLQFDSRFECGNLRKAIQVTEEEYDLILRPDINTFRYHQWFYFEVSNMRSDITYRFNIINFEKINSQFNTGMQPVMFSVCEALDGKPYWRRVGDKVSYYKNNYAYHYPYTYTTLMTDLVNWSNTYDQSSIYFRQQVLCKTLSGNDCPVLTITSFHNQLDVYHSEKQTIPMHERSYVILTARVHPGESNASWIMKGIIDYLLSDEPTARLLRDRYIFKIVPMLNPDGVINGCQRCSLATKDLNRQWSSPNSVLFPTIYHTKGLMAYLSTCCSQPITLFCDFHGHSRQKNFFFYGNDPRLHYLGPAVGRSTIPKVFPKLFTGVPGFALQNCLFTMRKQKEGCARMVVWDEFKVDFAYTMEATYNGFDVGSYKGLQIQISTLQAIGHDFCQVLLRLGDQELKTTETVLPNEELYTSNEQYTPEQHEANGVERRRSSSTTSSSSSSSSSLSLTDGDNR